jgi:hypothetical protein
MAGTDKTKAGELPPITAGELKFFLRHIQAIPKEQRHQKGISVNYGGIGNYIQNTNSNLGIGLTDSGKLGTFEINDRDSQIEDHYTEEDVLESLAEDQETTNYIHRQLPMLYSKDIKSSLTDLAKIHERYTSKGGDNKLRQHTAKQLDGEIQKFLQNLEKNPLPKEALLKNLDKLIKQVEQESKAIKTPFFGKESKLKSILNETAQQMQAIRKGIETGENPDAILQQEMKSRMKSGR